jgi:hypothetical protein
MAVGSKKMPELLVACTRSRVSFATKTPPLHTHVHRVRWRSVKRAAWAEEELGMYAQPDPTAIRTAPDTRDSRRQRHAAGLRRLQIHLMAVFRWPLRVPHGHVQHHRRMIDDCVTCGHSEKTRVTCTAQRDHGSFRSCAAEVSNFVTDQKLKRAQVSAREDQIVIIRAN